MKLFLPYWKWEFPARSYYAISAHQVWNELFEKMANMKRIEVRA